MQIKFVIWLLFPFNELPNIKFLLLISFVKFGFCSYNSFNGQIDINNSPISFFETIIIIFNLQIEKLIINFVNINQKGYEILRF